MANPQHLSRRYAKRKARQTYRHLDTVMMNLRELATVFEIEHPDHARVVISLAEMILVTQNEFVSWYKLTWGSIPANWYGDA